MEGGEILKGRIERRGRREEREEEREREGRVKSNWWPLFLYNGQGFPQVVGPRSWLLVHALAMQEMGRERRMYVISSLFYSPLQVFIYRLLSVSSQYTVFTRFALMYVP